MPSVGWNESALRALVVHNGTPHVVLRAPGEGDDREAVYTLRPISSDAVGPSVGTHRGVLGALVSGEPQWVVEDADDAPIRAVAFGDSRATSPVYQPREHHAVRAKAFWVRGGGLAGAVITEYERYATAERQRRRRVDFPRGGVGVRISGPDPRAIEQWLTPIGAGARRPVLISRQDYTRGAGTPRVLVVGGEAGVAVVLVREPRRAATVPRHAMEVIRFDTRGHELWRQQLGLDDRPFEPIADLHDDGSLEVAWRGQAPTAHVATFTESSPPILRIAPLAGELTDHHLQIVRCGADDSGPRARVHPARAESLKGRSVPHRDANPRGLGLLQVRHELLPQAPLVSSELRRTLDSGIASRWFQSAPTCAPISDRTSAGASTSRS